MKNKYRVLLVITVIFLFLSAACSPTTEETGILEGHVTIGPLVPVVREGVPEPTPAPEVFAARKVVVYREDNGKEVARLDIDADGNYRGVLPVGTYVVDINHQGIDFAKGFPIVVEIRSGQVTRLDVDIDTGIR
ncbi:MAG: hypothetical protein GTO18_10520 [Anaerolineales bacterium]|nr:hypothetical protein [Anaerolineales bacterium]